MDVTADPHPGVMLAREPWTEPFWEALADGRLLLGWCDACDGATYPPVDERCPSCGALHTWRDASGAGRLWSWTTMHREYVAGYPLAPPYTVVIVDLPEGVRVLATLAADIDPADLRPDATVVFDPQQIAPGVTIPGFRPER